MSIVDTHAAIVAWTNETFGPAASNFRIATRANEELAEALRAIAADPTSDKAAVEAADTIIVLSRLAHRVGLDWGAFEVDPRTVPAKYESTRQYFTAANRAMARLLSSLAIDDDYSDTPELVGIVYVVLQWAIRQWGLEPADVIAGKMAVNRGRTWTKQGDGTVYHVRAKESDKVSAKPAGMFMGIPVFVSKAMPDDTLAIFTRQLNSAPDLDAVALGPHGNVGQVTFERGKSHAR